MIDMIFKRGTEVIMIRLMGGSVLFGAVRGTTPMLSPIDGLKLSTSGILLEFPDLEGKSKGEIRTEAIKRFKEKIKSFKTDEETKQYVKEELERVGYKLHSTQKQGFRVKIENRVKIEKNV